MSRKRWIQGVHIKEGALHKQLGIKDHISFGLMEKIEYSPVGKSVEGHKVTPLLKKRVQLAENIRRQ